MTMPERIQRRRERGWRLPERARIVDRSTRWGNPWIIRERLAERGPADNDAGQPIPGRWVYDVRNADTGHFERTCETQDEAHRLAVRMYRDFTLPYRLDAGQLDPAELAGHDLACYCPLDLDCHARVLLEYANRPGSLALAGEWKPSRPPKQHDQGGA